MLAQGAMPFAAVELKVANSPGGKLKLDERQRCLGKSVDLKKIEDMIGLRVFLKQARPQAGLFYHASEEAHAAAPGAYDACA
jgi:hypothetical protein